MILGKWDRECKYICREDCFHSTITASGDAADWSLPQYHGHSTSTLSTLLSVGLLPLGSKINASCTFAVISLVLGKTNIDLGPLWCYSQLPASLRQYENYLVIFYLDTLPLSGVQEMTIDMTGQMSPPQRAEQWQGRRVFFVTPQCLEKDINSGSLTYLAHLVPALAFLSR